MVRKTRVRKHKRRKPTGGYTIVSAHDRQLGLGSFAKTEEDIKEDLEKANEPKLTRTSHKGLLDLINATLTREKGGEYTTEDDARISRICGGCYPHLKGSLINPETGDYYRDLEPYLRSTQKFPSDPHPNDRVVVYHLSKKKNPDLKIGDSIQLDLDSTYADDIKKGHIHNYKDFALKEVPLKNIRWNTEDLMFYYVPEDVHEKFKDAEYEDFKKYAQQEKTRTEDFLQSFKIKPKKRQEEKGKQMTLDKQLGINKKVLDEYCKNQSLKTFGKDQKRLK